MIILRHPYWEHSVVFNDGSFTELLIENTTTFSNYIFELRNQVHGEEGLFVLSEANVEISMSNNLSIITDPLFFDMNEKSLNQRVLKVLTETISSGSYEAEYTEVISALDKLASAISTEMPVDISYDEILGNSILKMLNFHIDPNLEKPINRLWEYITYTSQLLGKTNFIVVNPYLYFDKEQLETLKDEMRSAKNNLLFIDRFLPDAVAPDIIIDTDNCEPKI